MKTFQNKTVLITGGTSGIGKATALAFAKEGANVVISGRRVAEGEKLAKEITSAGGSALFVRTDVAREDDIVALVEKTVGTFGALHIAFNNAGTEGQFGLLTTEQTVEHYHQVCDINIRGVLLSMKHEIPAMLRSGGGAIVNNSSVGGHIGFPGSSVYVASKFAVIGLTKTAALEFAKQGVRVNSVSPGPIQTEMFDRAFGEGDQRGRIRTGFEPSRRRPETRDGEHDADEDSLHRGDLPPALPWPVGGAFWRTLRAAGYL